MTTLKVGIASFEQFKEYTLAIARGEYKRAPGEPKIWFSSIDSFAKVLSESNRELLKVIAETKPESLQALADKTGRAKSKSVAHAQDNGALRLGAFREGQGPHPDAAHALHPCGARRIAARHPRASPYANPGIVWAVPVQTARIEHAPPSAAGRHRLRDRFQLSQSIASSSLSSMRSSSGATRSVKITRFMQFHRALGAMRPSKSKKYAASAISWVRT